MKFPTSMRRLALTGAAGLTAVALVAGCGSSSSSSSGGFPGTPASSSATASDAPSTSPSSDSSSGSDSSNPRALLAASVDKVKTAKNSKVSLDAQIVASGKDVKFGGDGVVDYANNKLQLTIELPSSLTGGTEIGSIEERVIGDTAYIKFPDKLASQLGGKTWFKIPTSELSKGSSSGTSPFGQDPSQVLATLQSVSDKIDNLGKVDIRGTETTHYRAYVDLTKAASTTGTDASQLEGYKQLTGSDTLPEDVYLDSDGLPRRVSLSIEPKAGSSAAAELTKVAFSIDFYDFGKADTGDIVAPPADGIGTLPSGALGGIGS